MQEDNTYPAPVVKTGLTTPFSPHDDGALKKGVAWPNPRFTDNNDGTVTDDLTGLIWLKNANAPDTTREWQSALDEVACLNTNGTMNGKHAGDTSNDGSHQTDWRLPNLKELQSLIDYGQVNPALPEGHPFTGVQTVSYWSSSTCTVHETSGWYVSLGNGNVRYDYKSYPNYVWPVRGG